MADEKDETAGPGAEGEQPEHAVPSEDAREIAGSAEDAALEAAQKHAEAPASAEAHPPPEAIPAGEGHAVPSAEAQEVAGSAEDAPLEAAQEAQDRAAEEAAVDEGEPEAPVKPAVPGAHLEVDIVPEGVDPLGRGEEQYEDRYAAEDDTAETPRQPARQVDPAPGHVPRPHPRGPAPTAPRKKPSPSSRLHRENRSST